MRTERGKGGAEEKFEASKSWFVKFRERRLLHNIKVQGEAASAVVETAVSYRDLTKTMNEADFTKQQIFHIDQTAFYWKSMPSRTFHIWRIEIKAWLKASKDRLALLLGTNAAGDFKLKPGFIYHLENARLLKNYGKSACGLHQTELWCSTPVCNIVC